MEGPHQVQPETRALVKSKSYLCYALKNESILLVPLIFSSFGIWMFLNYRGNWNLVDRATLASRG